MNKSELRTYIKRQFRQTTAHDREKWSGEICRRMGADRRIKDADCIMAFYPLGDEVDIVPLLDALRSEGKIILLPVVTGDSEMILRRYEGSGTMVSGVLGTQNPQGNEFVDYDKIEVALVPGQAFDKAGHRLGRGKGYYDRFLKKLRNAYTMAVCFPYQVVDSVPFEPHDMIIDHV